MKVLLALAVLAASSVSFAQSERDLYDVMYLPKSGTVFGITEAALADGKIQKDKQETDFSGYSFGQTVGYAITDNFSLSASIDWSSMTTDPAIGDKTDEEGLGDPSLFGRYRVLDGSFRLDIIAEASIGIEDAELKENGDSNTASGGHSGTVGAQIGQKTKDLQWALVAAYTRNLEREVEVRGEKYDLDPNNAYFVRGDIQARLTEISFLNPFVVVRVSDEVKGDNGSESGSATMYQAGFEYKHLCTQNLLARVGIAGSQTYANGADQNDMWTLLVGANYQF